MIKLLHDWGVRSEHAYIASVGAMALTYVTHYVSRLRSQDDKSQSDRWGIFIATWPPTLLALGIALRLEEK